MMQQEQQEVIQPEVYFVPPPINELNKNYYQQLQSIDNPVYHATKSYVSYNELFQLDQSDYTFQSQMITEKLKETLKSINRTIYSKMAQYLLSLSGQASLDNIKNQTEFIVKQQIFKFMQICQSVKKYQTRRDICSIMMKETELIKQRTKQILAGLQQVKDGFRKVVQDEKSMMNQQ